MKSFWQNDVLCKDVDFTIVGAGYSGLFSAYFIKSKYPKAKVLLLDDNYGRNAASNRNAGFACFGSPSELLHDIDLMGEDAAFSLLAKRWQGIQFLEKHWGRLADFAPSPAHEVFLDHNSALYDKCIEQTLSLNYKLKDIAKVPRLFNSMKPIEAFGASHKVISISGEAQINPYLLHSALLRKCISLGIFYDGNYLVEGIEKRNDGIVIFGAEKQIQSKNVVICTNGFTNNLVPIQLKPARAQVLITNEIEDLAFCGNFHLDEGYYYFRTVGKRILLGGGRNLDFATESTTELAINEQIQAKLLGLLCEFILPNQEPQVTQKWAGIMGMRKNKIPAVENHGNYIHSIVGLSGMGVALAPVLAKEWADMH